jgi:hypothetical protein
VAVLKAMPSGKRVRAAAAATARTRVRRMESLDHDMSDKLLSFIR